jgi:mono/diheme cytochrome c family protein
MADQVHVLRGGTKLTAAIVIATLLVALFIAFTPTAAQNTPPGQAATAGNPETGRALFIEEIEFTNDGPACIGCHSIDHLGILGGGVMGPDLGEAGAKYSEEVLVGELTSITFPTMEPIFDNHPLTGEEAQHLAAFILSLKGQIQPDKELLVLGVSMTGFLAIMAVAAFYWRKRLGPVRASLVEGSRKQEGQPWKR